MPTRTQVLWLAVVVGVAASLCMSRTAAQSPTSSAKRCEVAIVKWDGPDRIQFITPDRAELVRVFEQGVEMPKGIRDEAFCLTWAANQLAREGWEPVNLNATRILMQRQVMP